MDVSIIICTRNRAEALSATLTSLSGLHVPRGISAELVIVDNGSTDATAGIVKGWHHPRLETKYLHEPAVGQCHCRNAGIAGSRGDILLFTDDDVRAPADWIEKMREPIYCGEADAVAGGVRIAPHLEREGLAQLRSWLAGTDEIHRQQPDRMVGANMAFARRVLEKVPAFDTDLGPGALGFADETLFSWQLREAGFRIAPNFEVEVEHHFDESRLEAESLREAAKKMARSNAYIFHHWRHEVCRFPRMSLLRAHVTTAIAILSHPTFWRSRRGRVLPRWRLDCIASVEFLRWYVASGEAPRLYDRRGLIKRRPI